MVQCDRSTARFKAKTEAGLPGLTHITCVNTVKQDLEVSDVTGIQFMVASVLICAWRSSWRCTQHSKSLGFSKGRLKAHLLTLMINPLPDYTCKDSLPPLHTWGPA